MATEVQQASPPSEPRFSRYRSVRKAQQQQQQQPALPEEPVESTPTCPVSRSMSRYHRKGQVPANSPPATSRTADLRRANTQQQPPSTSRTQDEARTRAQSNPAQQHASPPDTASQPPQKFSKASVENDTKHLPKTARDEARELLANEAERQKRMQAKIKTEKKAKYEVEEAARVKAQQEQENAQRQREQEESEKAEGLRLEREAERAAKARARQSEERRRRAEEQQRAAEHAERQKEELLKAAQSQAPREIKATPPEPLPAPSPRHGGLKGFFKRRKTDESPKPSPVPSKTALSKPSESNGPPKTIKPGGAGMAAGIDAPISAVNAGDRRVLVECNKSSVLLPVTPTTTALDLIRSASNCLSEPIDPKASVLLESFSKVGVQRPLRNYEHVRDVLNSWDDDMQNSLVVVESATGGDDKDLSAAHVPEERPAEYSCSVYYSQIPGKWSKRWITLRSDGQMLSAKNDAGKDSTNVCHLSDFDIYTPTPRQIAKKVKPPKKICFAIKSQQKSNMFMTTTSYVHFFCTNDKNIATAFYKAVQGWRSWYLVNIMGEGQKKPRPAASEPALADLTGGHEALLSRGRSNSFSAAQPGTSTSQDSHYQLGSFKPLLDMSQFSAQPPSERRDSSTNIDDPPTGAATKTLHERKMSLRTKNPPPVSYPTHASKDSNASNRLNSIQSSHHSAGTAPTDETTFAPTGLLGRTYSTRQKAQRERDALAKNPTGPFTDGPSLLNNPPTRTSIDDAARPTRMTSVRSTTRGGRESSDIKRTPSAARREKPRPLVDLTPQYQEPPQFAKKGRGFKPETLGPGGLIDCATSPDVAIAIPPALDWRRPTTSAGQGQGFGGAGDRTRSLRGNGIKLQTLASNNHGTVPENSADAFTGQGLLAHAGFSQGDVARGHGVMSGANARGPMLDVREGSRFAPGSLLADVEGKQPRGLVIDREKRREEEVPTGEGL